MKRTIAAISTARGEAAIGIVRMSGPESKEIAERIFLPARKISEIKPRHMYYGKIRDPESGDFLDEVLCVFMKGPQSYTGEDMVEIQCHGSLISIKNILELCCRQGAVFAERGEFTKLAFLNGRMDLAQAEAVIDMIKARTDSGFETAFSQLSGKLSERVRRIRVELLNLLAMLGVNMDYPDEDIEELSRKEVLNRLSPINDEVNKLLAGAEEGKLIREGLGVAIIGRPNVGKSSLMNLLLKEDRSIVTDIPGTTRDTIEEQLSLRGIPIRLTDTAGIHDSKDIVESLGIERSKAAADAADIIIFLLDLSRPLSKDDEALMLTIKDRPCIAVLNKEDLEEVLDEEDVRRALPSAKIVRSSLIDDDGAEVVKDALEELISSGKARRENDILITSIRHQQLLKEASEEIELAIEQSRSEVAIDLIEMNVRAAFDLLGEITGDSASGEIIDAVFERFCLGK